jgi:hypothetical protein
MTALHGYPLDQECLSRCDDVRASVLRHQLGLDAPEGDAHEYGKPRPPVEIRDQTTEVTAGEVARRSIGVVADAPP